MNINVENEIKNPDSLFTQVTELLPCFIFWKDTEGYFMGCNTAFANYFGFKSPKDLIGKTDYDLPISTQEANKFRADDKIIVETKQSQFNMEEMNTNANGKTQHLLTNKIPLKSPSGSVYGTLGICLDITPQKSKQATLNSNIKAVESQVETNAQFLKKLIESLPVHIFWKDKDGYYLGCNTLFSNSLGLKSPSDIVGKTDFELPVDIQNSQGFRLDDIDVISTKKSKLNIEEEQITTDGEKKYLLTSKVPISYDNHSDAVGVLGIYSDITPRKILEKEIIEAKLAAESASAAKTEFLINMSHDLRTPFSGILGLSNHLLNIETDPEKKSIIKDIVSSGNCLLNLINNILDFSRFEATGSSTQLQLSKVNIKGEINSTLDLYTAEISRKKLSTSIEYENNTPTTIITDLFYFQKILLNLISNAIKFTNKGTIKIHIKLLEPTQRISIQVIDTGIGISNSDQKKIFDTFSRSTPSHDGLYKGLGLGLNMVKKMVSQLNGDIFIDSEINKGSTFTIHLPLTVNTDSANLKVTKPPSFTIKNDIEPFINAINKPTPNVLVLDDDAISQRIANYVLTGNHCNATLITHPDDALKLDIKQFDIALIDIGLPDISGVEVMLQFRDQLNDDHNILFIALTASVTEELYQQYRNAGFDEVLKKPLACHV